MNEKMKQGTHRKLQNKAHGLDNENNTHKMNNHLFFKGEKSRLLVLKRTFMTEHAFGAF